VRTEDTISAVVAGLQEIGYRDALLEERYKFPDWFTPGMQEREVIAAAFGQTPISYDSACIGVISANGLREQALVNQYRALGAPIILEVDASEVREWAVSRSENGHAIVDRYPADRVRQMFASRAPDWKPPSLLRAKNIGSFQWNQQLGLFAGLLPELEEHIQSQLDPLLRDAMAATRHAYMDGTGREPDGRQLFKLVFWLLTAKVFHDRRVSKFGDLNSKSPDDVLKAVAKEYNESATAPLSLTARQTAAERIWQRLDFRNLSVEVLAQIWSTTLVDQGIQKKLGVHRTPRTVVRYIVERVFPPIWSGDKKQIILEPCSGSAAFLIGAINFLRPKMFAMSQAERHTYYTQHLAAIEKDPFGVEISRLALTLADFPNLGGWQVESGDVFKLGTMAPFLKRSAIVLCNPPFEDFSQEERADYEAESPKKPVQLLHMVLDDLHPDGVLGFVLPVNFIDGQGYDSIRGQIASRYAAIELTDLPGRVFESDAESVLLLATEPISHERCRVSYRKVDDNPEALNEFRLEHKVSSEHAAEFMCDDLESSMLIPALPDVWDFLINYPALGDFAELGRGIEWNQPLTKDGVETGNRTRLVRNTEVAGFRRGIAPKTDLSVFEVPPTQFLDLRVDHQRGNAWQRDWDKPKAIFGKSRKSRGPWRIAAFPDVQGLTFYQTYTGAWPKSTVYDEHALAAILNSPVANAFVATREGKRDITIEMLKLVPMPHFTPGQLNRLQGLIHRYQTVIGSAKAADAFALASPEDPSRLLKEIDAVVLDGYRLPPRVERQLLEFFRDARRPTPHDFKEYLPADCDVCFSLSEHLAPEFAAASAGELLRRMARD
jgi:hypothetical protein